jgi:maltose alpha-D-glucosyltransferase/alpha-amylase
MEDGFVDAYMETMVGEPTLPAEADAHRLIRFFTIEKALYEVRYELGNRPDWVRVPLDGLLALSATPQPPAAARVRASHRKRPAGRK